MDVHCPLCHTPVDLSSGGNLSTIVCPACGNSFSLLSSEDTAPCDRGTSTIGHFELVNQVGLGSFGCVWKARDTELDRVVAVKIPRKGRLDPEETGQFLREARAAAQLRHPNIVSVHEVGREKDTVFIVSDFVEGVTLADRLTVQPFSVREAAELCAKIADALHHAHEIGVIHRDLKPGNIILDLAGEPHIMDFGLARREMGEVTMTVEGRVLGTPAYMSPEQAQGSSHTADRRSDVYSLGVTLFELLTGARPFRGNVRMLVHQVINDEPPSPRRLNGNIPQDLETICLKCLEKQPARRYADASRLADDLRRFLGGEAIEARPISRLDRAWRWCKRHPTSTALAGVVAAIALVGPVIAVNQRGLRVRADRSAVAEAEARRAAEGARDEYRRLLYTSDMSVADQAWQEGNVDRVLDMLQRHTPHGEEPDLRGFEWYYLWQLCQRSVISPTFKHENTGPRRRRLAFSGDGRTLVVHRIGDGELHIPIFDLSTGTRRRALEGVSPQMQPRRIWYFPRRELLVSWDQAGWLTLWKSAGGTHEEFVRLDERFSSIRLLDMSSDGDVLAIATAQDTFEVWDLDKRQRLLTSDLHGYVPFQILLSPNGHWLAISGEQQDVRIWDVVTGESKHTLAQPGAPVLAAFCPDNETLVSWSWGTEGRLKLWSVGTGELISELVGHTKKVHTAVFSPGGETLATASLDRSVILWNVGTGTMRRRPLTGHTNWPWPLAFSPNGETLASAGADNVVMLWDVGTGRRLDVLKGHSTIVSALSFSPDGRSIASTSNDGVVKLWDLSVDREPNVIRAHGRPVDAVAISPDGKTAASAGRDDKVKLWDLATGKMRQEFHAPSHIFPGNSVLAISTDGIVLAVACHESIELRDTRTGEILRRLPQSGARTFCVAFSPDGRSLASGKMNGNVVLWDSETASLKAELNQGKGVVTAVCFSPDGRDVAAGTSLGAVTVWDVASKQKRYDVGLSEVVYSLAYSDNGHLAVSQGADLLLLRATDGSEVARLLGHSSEIRSVALVHGRHQLVSASIDRMVKLWSTERRTEQFTFRGHAAGVLSLAASADGRTLLSGDDDGDLRIWRAATETHRFPKP